MVHTTDSSIASSAGKPAAPSVLVGLIGHNIQRSRTPRMHEVEGARQGLTYAYRLIDTARLPDDENRIEAVLKAARICGFDGLNVTYPHKQSIVPLLDGLSADAEQVGAVNTVTFTDEGAIGHNTDKFGFAEGFRRQMRGAPVTSVLQLGAGGAGAAVASALLELGAQQLFIADLDQARAKALVARLKSYSPDRSIACVNVSDIGALKVDGLVNTTPVGMDKTPGLPIDPTFLCADLWVADVIYFPLETALLREARALGCRTLSGSAMAVFQAVKAFELFTGRAPDSTEMQTTFDAFRGNGAE